MPSISSFPSSYLPILRLLETLLQRSQGTRFLSFLFSQSYLCTEQEVLSPFPKFLRVLSVKDPFLKTRKFDSLLSLSINRTLVSSYYTLQRVDLAPMTLAHRKPRKPQTLMVSTMAGDPLYLAKAYF